MGCSEAKEKLPILISICEPGNTIQKNYFLELNKNLKPPKRIKFEIRSFANSTFSINLKINDKMNIIETTFNESQMQGSIEKINQLLREAN